MLPAHIDINQLALLALKAGKAIMENRGCEVNWKDDTSPVTQADLAAHNIITSGLTALYPECFILSEEGRGNQIQSDLWFLIDPLDGTKEFIRGSHEFCVIITVIYQGFPVKSVIYAPATDDLYCADGFASKCKGKEFKGHVKQNTITCREKTKHPVALLSRSHPEPELMPFYEKRGVKEFVTCGSALKFALLAEGKGDIYARFTSLSIWDIAGGQALVEAAGGEMQSFKGERMSYNHENEKSIGFIAKSPHV
jgi:3'(2'), 5'-bisphosphate nucleotidase